MAIIILAGCKNATEETFLFQRHFDEKSMHDFLEFDKNSIVALHDETSGFRCLDYTIASRLALLLGRMPADDVVPMMQDIFLSGSVDPTQCSPPLRIGSNAEFCVLPQVLSAYVLARAHSPNDAVVRYLREQAWHPYESGREFNVTNGLAILALGYLQDRDSAPLIYNELINWHTGTSPLCLLDAAALFRDLKHSALFLDILRGWSAPNKEIQWNPFVDPAPRLLRALLMLGQEDALGVYVKKVLAANPDGGPALEQLSPLRSICLGNRPGVSWEKWAEGDCKFSLSSHQQDELYTEIYNDAEMWLVMFPLISGYTDSLPSFFRSLA